MAGFDIQGARKAGYSDKEIADHLAASMKFDAEGARKSGYGDKDIIDHLAPGPGMASRAASAVVGGAADAADWLATRGAKAGANILGIPGAVSKGFDWASEKTGLPKAAFGPAAWMTQIAGMPGMPSQADYEKYLQDNPYLNVGPAGVLQSVARAVKGGSTTPETNLPGPVGTIVDKGVESLLTAPMLGGAGAANLVANTLGGSGSELAGQVAKQVAPEYETAFRVGGGFVGGLTGAVIPSVVRKGGQIAKAAVEPFTAGGREKIVGRTMFNVADDPALAITNMDRYVTGREAYPTPTPGFNLTASKAAGDDALMATENALDRAGAGFGEIKNANNVALTNALNALDKGMDPRTFVAEIAKVDTGAAMRAQAALDALPKGVDAATAGQAIQTALSQRSSALTTARSAAVNPLYAEARAFPDDLKIGPVFQKVDDAIANSKGDIQKAMEKAKSLLFNEKGQPDWSAKGMMNARAELDDMIGKAERAGSSNEVRLLMGIKNEIDNSLSFIPAEQQARQTFAAMSRPLDPFSAEQGAKNVANVIAEGPYRNAPLVAAEKVPATFFRPGDAGAATMKEFLAANGGNADAINAMKNYIAGQARSATDVKAFLLKNRQAIETLDPALARQLEDAAATTTISQGFKASPAGKFLDQDLDAAIRSTLGAPDSANRMKTLALSAGSDPQAVQGLQKAILDDFRRSVGAPVAEGGGTPLLTAAGASKWLEANRATVANVLTPDQVAGLEAITRALKDQGQTARAVAGSDTARNLATRSLLEAIPYGNAAWLGGMRKLLSIPLGTADDLVMQRLIEVMQDPRAASALMKAATPGNAKMVEPLLESLAKGAALPALTSGRRESP